MLKNNIISALLVALMFFIQYLGVGVYGQILVILLILFQIVNRKFHPITNFDIVFLLCVLSVFFIKVLNIGVVNSVLILKFYFGFLLFYVFFKITKFNLNYKLFFILTCFVTAIDFILINTIVPIQMMKNVPGGEFNVAAQTISGDYYRCYGLGSSPTVSATIVVVLLASVFYYQRNQYKDIYLIFASLVLTMFGSGTGFLLFFLFLFFRFKLYKGLKIWIGLLVLILFVFVLILIDQSANGGLFSRISIVYLDVLFDFKIDQTSEVLLKIHDSIIQTLFGYNYATHEGLRIMSDFGWLDSLEAFGYIGTALIWIFVIVKKKFFNPPVFLLMIGAFHYPALFSIPGQILFATLLTRKGYTVDEELKSSKS